MILYTIRVLLVIAALVIAPLENGYCQHDATNNEQVMLVLDVSGSMWGQIDGVSKIVIARAALKSMVADWPSDRQVGLIAYGHRTKGDCNDIQTVIPLGKLDKNQLEKTVDRLTPRGKTPLSASVKLAAEELKFTENKATVILISDGIETCDLDPCKVGTELEKLGVDFTAHVIGFDVSAVEDQKGLRCLAENTGGRFIAAANAEQLNAALKQAVQTIKVEEQKAEVVPIAKAELIAPESGVKGTETTFEIKGEAGIEGYVYLYPAGKAKSLNYSKVVASETSEGYAPGKIRLPAEIGEYELKLKDQSERVLAETKVKVIDAKIAITAPAEVAVATQIDFALSGPDGLDGYVYLYGVGKDKSLSYDRVVANELGGYKNGKIRVPATAGDYVLKWRTGAEEVLAEATFKVVAAEISLKAPSEASIATEIDFIPSGPQGLDGYVYIYATGKSKSISYQRVTENETGGYRVGKLRMPTVPGNYTLKWLGNNDQVLAETSLEVKKIEVQLAAPSEAPIATEVKVTITAPDGLDGYIYLYPQGKDRSITYARVVEKAVGGYEEVAIRLPVRPGGYELKWLSSGDGVLATRTINVVSAEVAITAPAEVSPEVAFNVSLNAPSGIDGYLYLYKVGVDQSLTYYQVVDGSVENYETIEVDAPQEPGDYQLKWQVQNDEVIAAASFKVVGQ